MPSESYCFWRREQGFSWRYRQQTLLMTVLKSKHYVPCLRIEQISNTSSWQVKRWTNKELSDAKSLVTHTEPHLWDNHSSFDQDNWLKSPKKSCLVLGVILLWQDPRIVLFLLWHPSPLKWVGILPFVLWLSVISVITGDATSVVQWYKRHNVGTWPSGGKKQTYVTVASSQGK